MADAGVDQYTFHIEATSEGGGIPTCAHAHTHTRTHTHTRVSCSTVSLLPSGGPEDVRSLIQKIKSKGMKVGPTACKSPWAFTDVSHPFPCMCPTPSLCPTPSHVPHSFPVSHPFPCAPLLSCAPPLPVCPAPCSGGHWCKAQDTCGRRPAVCG